MKPDSQLLPRDRLLRDTFTPAETSLFGLILITANLAFWLADPRSAWLLGSLLIAAGLTPIILLLHQHTHPFFVTFLWPKFWLCTAPVWIFLLQFVFGLLQQPIGATTLNGVDYIRFEMPANSWLPVSTAAATTWLTALGFAAIYIVTVSLFLIPKSRGFFERLLPYLCLSAALPALFGYIQYGIGASKPLLTKGTGAEDFFGFFPYDGHWAAFAALWNCCCVSLALLTTRHEENSVFIQSSGPWYLTGAAVFGASAFMVEAHWPAGILMLTYAIMMLLFSINFITTSKDPNRKSIALFSGLISIVMFTTGFRRIFQSNSDHNLTPDLKQTAWELFRDNPWFGWGIDSFGHLLPFYGNDLLLAKNYERVGCDAVQLLAEVGALGLFPSLLLLVFLLSRYLKAHHKINLTNHLLIGLLAVVLLAFLDSPFMSPAVFLSFCTLLFIALRWADVTINKVDEGNTT